MGAGNMRLYVAPSRGVVVARLGGPVGQMAAAASNFDEDLWHRLAEAMPS